MFFLFFISDDRLRRKSTGRRNRLQKLEEAAATMPGKDDWKYDFEISAEESGEHEDESAYGSTWHWSSSRDKREREDVWLYHHIEALGSKKPSERLDALSSLVHAFSTEFLSMENKGVCRSITLLLQCLNLIERRESARHACLASRAIGLLAVTVGCGSSGHDIMEESISRLSEALNKSDSHPLVLCNILGCMAVVTFFGSKCPEETERVMRIIWEFICDFMCPKNSSLTTTKTKNKTSDPAGVLAAAISAWSFLLSTIPNCRVTSWQGPMAFFSDLVTAKHRSLRVAAGEALSLIYEIDRFHKFSLEDEISPLKERTMKRIVDLSQNKTILQTELFQHLSSYIEKREFEEIIVNVPNKNRSVKISSWAEYVQLNFFERYLERDVFLLHLQANKIFEDIFDSVSNLNDDVIPKDERLFLLTTDLVSHKGPRI